MEKLTKKSHFPFPISLYRGKRSESLGFATQKGEEVGVGAAGL